MPAGRVACTDAEALRVERVEQRVEVVLVRAASMEEDRMFPPGSPSAGRSRASTVIRAVGSGVSRGSICSRRCSKSGGQRKALAEMLGVLVGREAGPEAWQQRVAAGRSPADAGDRPLLLQVGVFPASRTASSSSWPTRRLRDRRGGRRASRRAPFAPARLRAPARADRARLTPLPEPCADDRRSPRAPCGGRPGR